MNAPDPEALRRPELYLNREFAALEFNRRVLELASDETVPPLERLRFLCLSCTGLDKFFEIRVGGIKARMERGTSYLRRDGLGPVETLAGIAQAAREIVAGQYRVFNESLVPVLAERGVRFLPRGEWNRAQARWARRFFRDEVLPVLTPIGLDPAHPFPRILNKSLNFVVELSGTDAFGRDAPLAVVQAPRSLARIIRIPAALDGTAPNDFVFLSSIIHAFVGELFPGLEVLGCHQFRVTRNSDLLVDDEEAEDLLLAVEGELASRRNGDAVRLEVAGGCPAHLLRFLLNRFELGDEDLYEVNGPVNLNRLSQVIELVDRPDLKYPRFLPGRPAALARPGGVLAAMRREDVLLHHPYQGFGPVVELAAGGGGGPGRARDQADALPDRPGLAGRGRPRGRRARRQGGHRRRRTHGPLRRGREHRTGSAPAGGRRARRLRRRRLQDPRQDAADRAARERAAAPLPAPGHRQLPPGDGALYADYGLLTCNARIGRDVHQALMLLTSPGRAPDGSEPGGRAAGAARAHRRPRSTVRLNTRPEGRPARIIAKLNALVEPEVIEALYAPHAPGVQIDLIVRGTCCLRPGVPGASENIRVRSLVGRFLEHARVFLFGNGGATEVYLSSADWMERNFFSRVEI
jgi:polyphosphate kinase